MATKKKKPIVLPRRIYPSQEERRYSRQLIAIVKELHHVGNKLADVIAVEMEKYDRENTERTDAKAPIKRKVTPVKTILSGIKAEFDTVVSPKRANLIAQGVDKRTTAFTMKTVDDQVRGVVTIPSTNIGEHKGFIKENVGLIKSIPKKLFGQIEEVVTENWTLGKSTGSLRDAIQERFGVAENRAMLIARDQVGKLNGQVAQERHKELGVKKYIWRTSLDERVRGNPNGLYPKVKYSHWAREGKVFRYDKPPPDGHPSFAIQCRCIAEPIIEELEGIEEEEG